MAGRDHLRQGTGIVPDALGLGLFPPEHACCHKCWNAYVDQETEDQRLTRMLSRPFIVCGQCGNKRCPQASDHDLDCTNSNDTGQKGSVYE